MLGPTLRPATIRPTIKTKTQWSTSWHSTNFFAFHMHLKTLTFVLMLFLLKFSTESSIQKSQCFQRQYLWYTSAYLLFLLCSWLRKLLSWAFCSSISLSYLCEARLVWRCVACKTQNIVSTRKLFSFQSKIAHLVSFRWERNQDNP